jgi:CBS domain-containing protein
MQRVHQTIADLGCTRDVPQMAPSDTVAKALDAMCRGGHECVLVVDDRPILRGIFTSRDFLRRVAAPRRDPKTIPLSEVMTEKPETLRPSDSVAYAINRMTAGGYRNVPIIGDDRSVLGVVVIWDVIRHLDDIFDDLRIPVLGRPEDDISGVTWIDTGGG